MSKQGEVTLSHLGAAFFLRFSATSAANVFFAAENAEKRGKEISGGIMEMLLEVHS